MHLNKNVKTCYHFEDCIRPFNHPGNCLFLYENGDAYYRAPPGEGIKVIDNYHARHLRPEFTGQKRARVLPADVMWDAIEPEGVRMFLMLKWK